MTGQNNPTGNKVVLAIDGSEHAMTAMRFIQNLQFPKTCVISIIAVLIPRNAQYHATLAALLEQTTDALKIKGFVVEDHLLTGYPAEQIIKFTQDNNPTLLVLGAKGLRGTLRILLGGVAQQVVNYAHCPVLLIRAPHAEAKKVLIVTDGSEHSEYVLSQLENCPLPSESQVTAMHVLPPEMTSEMLIRSWPYGLDTLPHIVTTEVEETMAKRAMEEEKAGYDLLNKTVKELAARGITANSILVRGDAATEIINYADENNIDLIIAGSRGLSQVQSLFLGSVSSKLTHYANCSVLILKKPIQED